MDYAVGSVAALISGNVTPNRPRLIKRALTPTKHQPSPNVTPKSECVDDRSIFLSPSLQRKKAIVKKSPKRIFQNPDLDITNDGEGSVLLSPKADKVKKHLKEDLEADQRKNISPKKGKGKLDQLMECEVSKKKISFTKEDNVTEIKNINESTPKKKKKKKQRNSISMPVEDEKENAVSTEVSAEDAIAIDETNTTENKDDSKVSPKKKRKKNKTQSQQTENLSTEQIKTSYGNTENQEKPKTKKKLNKKGKNKAKLENHAATVTAENQKTQSSSQPTPKKKNKSKTTVNPNAITNQDSDSEHESDDEIQSENEQTNNQILDTGPADTSDEEEEVTKTQKQEKRETKKGDSDDELKRTLFVGNVPFSAKCKKEIKKIFNKYGKIETVRIRTVPVKDARVTPKMAIIKNELHPERSTVNVYVRFQDATSVDQALAENNTVLNDNYLRVTRSDSSGIHDPRKAVFVGNLPFAVEDDTLRAKFAGCGQIESVRVVRDGKTNAGKGFGYVNFASKDGVELALAMSEEDLTIKNRILRVKRCTPTQKKPGLTQGQAGNQRNNERFHQNRSQGMKQRNQGGFGRQDGGRNQGNFRSQRFGRNQDMIQGQSGAHRRLLKKRHFEEGGGLPSKRPNITQPAEKKPRKEFVGLTAEKKRKHKFNKGDKKKKVLSEILTKYS